MAKRRQLSHQQIMAKYKRWYRDAVKAYPQRGHGWGLYFVASMWVRHLEREGFITVRPTSTRG